MKIPRSKVCIALAAGLLSSASVFAGSFTTDFSTQTGMTLAGGAFLSTNRAILTWAAGSLSGGITLDDLDGGQSIESFVANFKLQLGPGSGNAADGVSFNFGPNVVPGTVYGEEGPGGQALTIAFDTYDNGIAAEGVPTPSLDVRFQGKTIATHAFAKTDMVTGNLEDVTVRLDRSGRVAVAYKGQIVHTNVFVPGWAPTYGQFAISGRTGGEYEEQDVANLSISTVLVGTPAPVTIVTNPQSVTVNEGGSATFSVAVDGSAQFSFQWVRDGADMLDGTDATYKVGPVAYTDNNAKFKCRVSNAANTVTSTEATLTVIRDTIPPTVVKANADMSGTLITVVFSEAVSDTTALEPSNYALDQGNSVFWAERIDATRVKLHTSSPMPGGMSYTLSVHGVQDLASSPPNTIVPTQVTFRTYLFQLGAVVHKKYANLDNNNGSLNSLKNDPRYPNSPDRQDLVSSFEYPANGLYRDTVADPRDASPPDIPLSQQFSDTLEGFFIPPTTGDYVFYAVGADICDVYLSTDADPANLVNIARVSGWTNPREWMIAQGDTTTNGLRSDWYTGNMWSGAGDPNQGQALIHLDASQKYYMFVFHHRYTWSGADDFAVTYSLAGGAAPASGAAPLLTGNVIGTYLDPTGASVTFSQQPADVTVLQGRKATFTAAATGQSAYGSSVTYQWQTAPSGSTTFTNIPGATTGSFTTAALTPADSGRKYKVLASVPGFTQGSSIGTVTVSADTIAPKLVSASAIASQSGSTLDVGVTFDEPLDAASAQTIGNYTVAGGTVTAAKYFAGSPGVVLTVSGLTGSSGSVTVANVADPYGNHMSSANLPFTVSSLHWGVVGGDEAQLGNGVLAVSPNGFDVYSDGVTEWASYDESTFVYEQVTGDFDKEVRVEYQDPSSQWARAGLIARDVTNIGVNRAAQEGGQAGRYQKIHVNPVTTAMGTPGNNLWEGNRRLDTGGTCTSAITGPNAAPQYPNAWCRLKREGQKFTIFRSDDGINWVTMGTTTWGVDDTSKTPMPNTVYVGLDYSPENGNVSTGFKSMFVTKYRDYRNHAVPMPTLTITKNADGTFTLTYTGTLMSSDTVTGTYGPVTGASSPWTVNPKATGAKPNQFYRAQF